MEAQAAQRLLLTASMPKVKRYKAVLAADIEAGLAGYIRPPKPQKPGHFTSWTDDWRAPERIISGQHRM